MLIALSLRPAECLKDIKLCAKDIQMSCVNMQGCSYSCVVATPDSKALYVVGSDKKLKELEEVGGTGTQVTKELDTGVLVNSIALPAGKLRCMLCFLACMLRMLSILTHLA